MAEAPASSTLAIKITDENRRQFGGDFRMRAALMRPDGSMMQMKQRTLIPSGPGDLINKANPALELAVAAVELSAAPAAATQRLQLIDDGYKFCLFEEWDLSPRYRAIWEEAADGKIVTDAGGGYALALMWCEKETVEARHEKYRIWSDEVEKTFEERIAENVDKFDVATNQRGLNSEQNRQRAIERHLEQQERVFKRR